MATGRREIALRKDVVIRSLKVSAIVGSVLVLINYGDILFAGAAFPSMLWKIPLTYAVPYCVATYASVAAVVNQGRAGSDRN